MKIQAIIHTAEEGGYWAEVPALPGCKYLNKRNMVFYADGI